MTTPIRAAAPAAEASRSALRGKPVSTVVVGEGESGVRSPPGEGGGAGVLPLGNATGGSFSDGVEVSPGDPPESSRGGEGKMKKRLTIRSELNADHKVQRVRRRTEIRNVMDEKQDDVEQGEADVDRRE